VPSASLTCGANDDLIVVRSEANLGAIMSDRLRPHIWNRNEEPSLPYRNSAGQVRRRRVCFADGEMALVATAFSAKALRVGDSQIKCCALFPAGVLKIDAESMRT
jgi:hypothetical protein